MSGALSHHARVERLPEPGAKWIHLLPAGTFSGADGRGPYRAGDLDAIIARSMPNGRKLPIDENHAIDLQKGGGSTPARGWIVELQGREDGIWGRVEWTGEGRKLIDDKAYGFISPVFAHDGAVPMNVHSIHRAALTNNPNLVALASLHMAGAGTLEEQLKELLGLPATAAASEIVAKVQALLTSANSVDPSKYVPFEVFQATHEEMLRSRQGVARHSAEHRVNEAVENGQLLPAMREWAIELCSANAPAFDKFIGGAGAALQNVLKKPGISVETMAYNRAREAGAVLKLDNEIARNLGLSAEDVKAYGKD